jgi:hypothetical protein
VNSILSKSLVWFVKKGTKEEEFKRELGLRACPTPEK